MSFIPDTNYDRLPPWPAEADGLGSSLQLVDASQDNRRAGNWGSMATNDVNRATPGRANANRATLEPFPPLWINEVLADNRAGMADQRGEKDPWIELYNAGSATLDLSPYYLSNDPTNLAQWPFPPGSTLGPGGFLVVWADGQSDQSVPNEMHASFRLDQTNGFVALSRSQSRAPAALDYVHYVFTGPDQSHGSVIDGDPWGRRLLFVPTPGGPNRAVDIKAPRFSQISFIGDQLNLSWTTVPGHSYRIEFKDALDGAAWAPMGDSMEAAGESLSLSVGLAQSPCRVYRIVQQ